MHYPTHTTAMLSVDSLDGLLMHLSPIVMKMCNEASLQNEKSVQSHLNGNKREKIKLNGLSPIVYVFEHSSSQYLLKALK